MRGKVLLGWLTREEAIRYLQQECVFDPPLTEQQAEAHWAERRARVDGLDPRLAPSPPILEMTAAEREAADRFISFYRRAPTGLGHIQSVVKLDASGLVLRQLDINLDRANEYMRHARAATWCARNCLATERPNVQMNVTTLPNGWNFGLPHAEFMLAFNGQVFGIAQGAPHVSVSVAGARTVLWAGYHRCYVRAGTVNPEGIDRSVLAALTSEGALALAPESGNQSLRDLVFGERPPPLSDFFDERLFMEVELRRKRFELQIRVGIARIDAN